MAEELQNKLKPVKLFFTSWAPEGWDEKRAPIIFIPGFFSTNRTFGGVRFKISKQTKRKVYCIDLRNHGQSEYSHEFTVDHMVADFENFMKEQEIPKAVLAGHSMGGKIALAFALKHPDMIEKLIVEDVPVVSTEIQIEEILKNFTVVKLLHKKLCQLPSTMSVKQAQEKLLPFVVKVWPMLVKNFSATTSKFTLPFQKDASGKFKWEVNMDVVLEIQNHIDRLEMDLSNDPVYHGEVLLLAGGKSIIRVQDNLDDYHKYFPNFECRILENGFHTYHVEFPELYTKLVSKFIGDEEM